MKTRILANLEILEEIKNSLEKQKLAAERPIAAIVGWYQPKINTLLALAIILFGKAHLGRNRAVTIHKYAFRDEIE